MAQPYSLSSVKVQKPPADQFSEFLKRRGKRLTRQREVIVEMVFSHHDHFDADELMEHLSDKISKREVSRPTVYRTLTELTEAGMLRKMLLGGRGVYEHSYGYPSHDHLHCEKCNSLIEFHSDQLDGIFDAVAKTHDFHALGHRVFVLGVCAACRKSESSE
jgi:Fur family ferric uptake transcriptional regulator